MCVVMFKWYWETGCLDVLKLYCIRWVPLNIALSTGPVFKSMHLLEGNSSSLCGLVYQVLGIFLTMAA